MTDTNTRDIFVVGAGISGLTTAWHLQRNGVDVGLLEAQPKVGGAMQTEHRDGFLLEKGPFNVIVRDPAFEELLGSLSERISVVTASDEAKKRYLYRHGQLMAVPTNPISLFRSPLLSFGGALRATRGLFLSCRSNKPECTIEEFATRRFGAEVADTLMSAVVAGILAGDIGRLSAYDAFPVLREFDQHSISPLGRTFRRMPSMIYKKFNPKAGRRWKGLVSIDRGLGGMADAIAEELGERLTTGFKLDAIHTTDEGGFELHGFDTNQQQQTLHCRRLVLATPAAVTARLLAPHSTEAAEILYKLNSSSLTVINVAFRREDVGHPLDGFGFLVPRNQPKYPLMGVLWADSAFPHHAPSDQRLLRAFIGGVRTPDVISRDSDELVATAVKTMQDTLEIRGEPTLVDICPYPDAIPQYYLGHGQRIAQLREFVAAIPGLHLAGNYLDGVSINDCVRVGKETAHAVLEATAAGATA